jgi:HPt (histidine-containing phosphotransfer) domain-containing protein
MFETFLDHTLPEFDLFRAMYAGADWEGIRRLAHKLKPGCAMVGLSDLHETLEAMEQQAATTPEPQTLKDLLAAVESDLVRNLPVLKEQLEVLKTRAA